MSPVEMVQEVIDRIEHAERDVCDVLSETDPIKEFLFMLAVEMESELEYPASTTVHPLQIAAAAGYALGLSDAFAGMESLTAMTDGDS
jgi:hypothetical protein